MRQVAKAHGETLDEFIDECNEVYVQLSRHKIIDEVQVNETTRLIFYDDDGLDPEWFNRHCCECGHFEWSGGCRLRQVHREKMDHACQAFDGTGEEADRLIALDRKDILEVVS